MTPSTEADPIPFERTLLALLALATAGILGWMLFYAGYGLDFTDEGFYLNWIAQPFDYAWSVSQFGFVYHPLYALLDGDIANLRRANILIVFGLAWALFAVLLRDPGAATSPRHGPLDAALSAGLAVGALVVFSSALTTPNYNTLTLQALLIGAVGIALTRHGKSTTQVLAGALIGIGGWLAFMAKPSSAAALALMVAAYLVVTRRLSLRILLTAIVSTAVLLYASCIHIDGSVSGFVQRLRSTLDLSNHLNAGHGIDKLLRLDNYALSAGEKLAIAGFAGSLLIAMGSALTQRRHANLLAPVISVMFLVCACIAMAQPLTQTVGFGTYQGLVMAAFPAAALGLALAALPLQRPQLSHLWLTLFLLLLTYTYAFGTNGNYWWAQGFASAFWVASATTLLIPWARKRNGWAFALPIAFAVQAMSTLLLSTGLSQPYRQPQPLKQNDAEIAVRGGKSRLKLSTDAARYITQAQRAASENGLLPNSPLLDLTGQSPGLLYALQARAVGQAWLIGGYPGSRAMAEATLAQTDCEMLSNAWLLVEESGPRSLPRDVVASYGADWNNHFLLVASWSTSAGAGGYAQPREQQLFKPLDPVSVLSRCRALGQRSPAH